MCTIFFNFVILTMLLCNQDPVTAKPSRLQIVNGTEADEGEFPYMVQIIESLFNNFLCGGAIIGPEWILTTGTCVSVLLKSVVYGTNELYDSNNKEAFSTIEIEETIRHPNYTFTDYGFAQYDVGLIKLAKPIPFSDKVQPIPIVDADETIPFHEPGVLAGWGYNETWGNHSLFLQKYESQLLNDSECTTKVNALYHSRAFDPVHNICSDDYYSGQCTGDTGGAFVINGKQYGIVSWEYFPCGIVPGAYTRISNLEYRAFIKNITNI